ncbi:MAG TPA: NUDIX domain-containing protein [Bacillota bacterium]|nr:NUDIX domain-containing protein [Bacillota bacterium]
MLKVKRIGDEDVQFGFSVMACRYEEKWLFVRQNDHMTWETPGGHIEKGETPYQAALRETKEETGADEFTLTRLFAYEVDIDGALSYGVFWRADIKTLGEIGDKDEIAERKTFVSLPDALTYPEIQGWLWQELNEKT